jgi:hypothetical protein
MRAAGAETLARVGQRFLRHRRTEGDARRGTARMLRKGALAVLPEQMQDTRRIQ